MKKTKLLLIAIIGVFAMSYLKVNAASSTGTITDETTGIKFDIVKLNVYVFNKEGISTTRNVQEGANLKTKEIEDITFSPKSTVHQMHDKDLHTDYNLIEIKLSPSENITALQKKVKTEASTLVDQIEGGDGDKYLVALMVTYKVDKQTLKEGYNNIWDIDSSYVFSTTQKPEDVGTANDGAGLTQMLMTGIINKQTKEIDWTKGSQMNYGNNYIFTSYAEEMPLLDEYFLLSEGRASKGEEKYRFMMHIMDDVTSSGLYQEESGYYEEEKENNTSDTTPVTPSNSSNKNNSSNNKNEQITGVPNTAARNASITLFGSSLLALGSGVVLWELRKKFN